jgi:hypothetical protein
MHLRESLHRRCIMCGILKRLGFWFVGSLQVPPDKRPAACLGIFGLKTGVNADLSQVREGRKLWENRHETELVASANGLPVGGG